jgi:hypothetical protein
MRYGLLIILLLAGRLTDAQNWNSVLKGNPKKDEAFSRAMITIMTSAGHDFKTLPMKLEKYHFLDTTWDVNARLPGCNEATLSKSDGAAILTETFVFTDEKALDQLLQKIKASLPDDYVYNLDYDQDSNTYDYTFEMNPMSKRKHPGYPSYFHLTGDTKTAFVFMGRSPIWLINPR